MSGRLFGVRRHPELGSVTIVVAALWMGLFGMAALAVDAGHMYLTKRYLQDAADAAVMAGLPSLGSSVTTAQTNARNMAIKCGYPSGNITAVGTAGAPSTLTVTITASEPFFFAKVLGYSSKTVSATAVGQASSPVPAVFAGRNSCGGFAGGGGYSVQWRAHRRQRRRRKQRDGEHLRQRGYLWSLDLRLRCTSNIGGAANTGRINSLSVQLHGGQLHLHVLRQASWIFGQPGWFWQSGGPGGGGGTLMPGTYCATR